MQESGYYQDLDAHRRYVVPVVGAGLSLAAGAPSFDRMVEHLRSRAAEAASAAPPSADPFAVVDQLAEMTSEEWVQQETANLVKSCDVSPTPALLALTKVVSRLVVTTNYDFAIELAAAEVGRPTRTLTITDLQAALEEPGEELRILHLHGTADDPSSIVLTSASYARMWSDERVQLLLRDLAVRYRLVFLGHRLAEREQHLRRDLRWVSRIVQAGHARHLLVQERDDIASSEAYGYRDELEHDTGLKVVLLPDPEGRFMGTQRTAAVLAGPSSVASAEGAPTVDGGEFDQHYVTPAVADLHHVETEAGQGEYLAQTMFHGETLSESLDATVPRLALVAGAGMGKSEELRHIGLRSGRPALLQPLTAMIVLDGLEPAVQFVASMNTARSVGGPAAPKLTLDRLSNDSYVFLLDALDEVPPLLRPPIVRLIATVSDHFPQHRYVITTRAVPELAALSGFTRKTLVAGRRWLARYLARRALTEEMVDVALPDPSAHDLLEIPVFAAAVADDLLAGRALPQVPLDLLGNLADQRADPTRVPARPELLRRWLDRVALLMQVSGVNALSLTDLDGVDLQSDLPGFAPTPETLQHLASRALLTDSEDTVRFPANILREARAARHLLGADTAGLALLHQHALVELSAVLDSHGEPVRGIRSGWSSTLELLLTAAPAEWRRAVARYDPTLAARSTPLDAPAAERDAAVWTLWSWYDDHRVWIGTGRSPRGGDQAGLTRLLRAHVPAGFADTIRSALDDTEPAARGNAATILLDVVDREQALPELARLITDPHPVVRRRAATAAYQLRAVELVDTLVDQAAHDPDEMATSTLLMYAIDLAPDHDRAAAIALTAPPAHRDETATTLTQRLGRDQSLDLLSRTEPFPSPLLAALLHGARYDAQPDWTAAQVASLAHTTATHPEQAPWQGDLGAILQTHPLAAAAARLQYPAGNTLFLDIAHLTRAMTATQLVELATQLQQQPRQNDPDDQSARDHLSGYVDRLLHPTSPLYDDLSELDDADQPVFATTPPPPPPEPPAGEELDASLTKLAQHAADGQDTAPATCIEVLRRAAEDNTTLTEAQAQLLLRICLRWPLPDLTAWLAENWTHAQTDKALLDRLSDPELLNAPRVLPPPWPAALANAVLDACGRLPAGHPARLQTARILAEHDATDTLLTWAHTHDADWLDTLVVEIGDPEAEQRLLRQLHRHLTTTASPRPRLDLNDLSWLPDIRHPRSVPLLVDLVKTILTVDHDQIDTRPLHQALTRCAGPDAPRIWETLADDTDLPPAAAFLHYDRDDAVQHLIDAIPPPAPYDHDLQQTIRQLGASGA